MVNGRILDLETLTKYCQGCVAINAYKISHPERYELLKADHIESCPINHKGSAPAIEVAGATIFGRSMEKHNLRYTQLAMEIQKVTRNLYTVAAVKFECVSHIQRRVGNRLRKKSLMDLVVRIIDRLQNYFGIAIRTNIGDFSGMKSAIAAELFMLLQQKRNRSTFTVLTVKQAGVVSKAT